MKNCKSNLLEKKHGPIIYEETIGSEDRIVKCGEDGTWWWQCRGYDTFHGGFDTREETIADYNGA